MQISFQRLSALVRKETIQLLRDRRLLLFILGIPIVELVLYGYAAHLTVYHLPLIVFDQSRDPQSQAFVRALVNSQYFDWKYAAQDQAQVIRAIDKGQAKAGLVIPPDFAADIARGNANVLFLLDGSDTTSVQSGYSSAALVAQDFSVQIASEQVISGHAGTSMTGQNDAPITTLTQVLYNPDLVDIWFIMPGLVGLILQTLAITQAVLIVVKERELGTMEQILATPTRPLELMIAKIAPLLMLCLFAMAVVIGLGTLWFGVPFRGSLVLYFWLSLLFIASCLGLGLFLSTRAENQMEAQTYGLLFMLVGILMSGFMYPLEAMPPILRLVGGLFPVTYFIRISRGLFLKGVGLRFIWSDALVLAIYCLVIVIVAARSFKPRLD